VPVTDAPVHPPDHQHCGGAAATRSGTADSVLIKTTEVLLVSASRNECTGSPSLKSLIAQPFAWDYLLNLAQHHHVTPLLASTLLAHCSAELEPNQIIGLRQCVQDNVRSGLRKAGELLRVLEYLREREIEAIPYKGPVLAAEIYGDIALREFCDLDVLVRRRDVLPAAAAMRELGYASEFTLSALEESMYLDRACEYNFLSGDDSVQVELHWQIVPSQFAVEFDVDSFWQRSGTAKLGGVPIPTLSAEDLLLVLSVHAAKHMWGRLRWICDIAELLRARPALDWNFVLDEARRMGTIRMVYVGLKLASELLKSEIPKHVAAAIEKDRTATAIVQDVRARLFAEAEDPIERWERHHLILRARERWHERAKYVMRTLLSRRLPR
jgi:hypothetical protein